MPTRVKELEESAALAAAARAAVITEIETHCPAVVTLAQWALESGWGRHSPGNNCFGIKAFPGCPGTQELETTEYHNRVPVRIMQTFATFESLLDCFRAHARILAEGQSYRHVWAEYLSHRDPVAFARALAPIYATDPGYGTSLVMVMQGARVRMAVKTASEVQG